ncbi:MAG: TonB-dependent receptor [Chitinophagaceae bacterium]|nr:TonB-dependent receptor [Chitinophagaceae bacterium]
MKKLFYLCTVLLFSSTVFAQTRTITGVVKNAQGAPVPNASVEAVGSNIGTTTNAEGAFSLSVNADTKSLSVSSIGMAAQEIDIRNTSNVSVTLQAENKNLQEVVVVGYGVQKRPTITGAIARIGGAEIENRPFTSVDKALQGSVAGLQSVAASGQPGAAQNIRIRGVGSISAGAEPLWVIDGIPVNTGDLSRLTTTSNALSSLNPNDIESISVLKDASAASIYGSRAANGVILVTTKKGRAGKTKFRFDVEAGQSDVAYKNDKYRPLNADEYFTLTREGLLNGGQANPGNVDAIMASNFGFNNGQDFNWLDGVTQKGKQSQYNLSASGGNDKTQFFLSGGYFEQEGLTLQSGFQRYSTNVSINNKATDRLTFGFNLNAGYVKQDAPLNGGSFGNPVLSAFFILPSRNAYKPDGSFNITAPDFGPGAIHNTLATNSLDKRKLDQTTIRSSINGEYRILDNLKFTSRYGIDMNILEENQYNNPFHGDGFNVNGRAFSRYTRYFNYVWTNFLDYKQNISKDGEFYADVKVGYEAQLSKAYFIDAQTQGFPPTSALNVSAVGATPIAGSQTASDYAFASTFSVANINFKDKYVISGSFRRDGSSRFGANNQYGNFWSVGGTWNADREAFMADLTFISQLKLRASYGINGNAGIGNYDARSLYGYGANYNQQPGSTPTNAGNSDLTWELNKPLNFGLDLGFLKSRINLSFDYYIRKTSQLLLDEPVSRTSGFATITKNVGSMENKGIELTLNATPVLSKEFKWDIGFNFATNKNRITSLVNNADIVAGAFIRRVGYDFQTFYVRQYAGVDPANGDPLWYVDDTKSTTTNDWNVAQRSVLQGSATPRVFGSFTNTLTYMGFSFEAQFNYNFGNYIRDTWGGFYMGSGNGGGFNKVVRQLDRWQQPGDVTDVPKYVFGGNKLAQNFSTFYLNSGDFVRLRNIQLGYNVPKSALSKLHIGSCFLYVRGTNLWTWLKDDLLPFDPEQGVASETNLQVFIPKTVTVGINLGF